MITPFIDPVLKKQLPDELLEELLKTTEEFIDKVPLSEWKKMSPEIRGQVITTISYTMIAGAGITLNYIYQKSAQQ